MLIEIVKQKKPKHFLEIGVFCGVTSRNICEFLNLVQSGDFTYTGVDLFGDDIGDDDEMKPSYIANQKFSNPLKHIYYNLYLKENLNSLKSVKKFLKKFENKISLHKGDSNKVLKNLDIKKIDFAFIDGGHSEEAAQKDYDLWTHRINIGGILAIHDVFPNPKDGGRPPYNIYIKALESGNFEELEVVKSLRLLRKIK